MTNLELKKAFLEYETKWLDALDMIPLREHKYPDSFEMRIKNELRRAKRKKSIAMSVLKRVAIVVLMLAVSFGAVMGVSEQARATVRNWIRSAHDMGVSFIFNYDIEDVTLPEIKVEWIPEGFEIKDKLIEHKLFHVAYEDKDENLIAIDIATLDAMSIVLYGGDGEREFDESIRIKDWDAMYNDADETSNSRNILIIDEDKKIAIMVNTNLDKEIMIRVVESISIT